MPTESTISDLILFCGPGGPALLSQVITIMTTGLAGGLTKPYKGIRPAALTRSENLPTASPFTGSR